MREPTEMEKQTLVQTKDPCDKKLFLLKQNFKLAAALHCIALHLLMKSGVHAGPTLVLREISESIWGDTCSFHKSPTAQNLLEIIRPRKCK